MKKLLLWFGLLAALCCLSFAQVGDAGKTTVIRFGSALPSGANEWTFFTLTDGTGLYQCQHAPTCTNAGQWVVIGGSGGTCSGTCANLALSNITTTALAIPLTPAAANILRLYGYSDDGSNAATGVNMIGGAGGTVGNGASINVTSGAGSASHPISGILNFTTGNGNGSNGGTSGDIFIEPGPATTYGEVHIIAGPAGGFGSVQQSVIIATGPGTPSGSNSNSIFIGPGGPSFRNTGMTVPTLELYSGSSGLPGNIDIDLGGAAGLILVHNGVFNWVNDNSIDFDISTQRPRNAYFGGNVVAGGNFTGTGSATMGGAVTGNSLITSGSGPWQAQGSYGTLSASSAGKTRFGFGPLGPQFSYNGGALTYFATLDISNNVAQNANTATKLATAGTACAGAFATGVDAYGNALCNTATTVQLPWQTCSSVTPISGYGIICFDQPSSTMEFSLNASSFTQFVHPNLYNWNAPSGASPDYIEQRDATTPQHFCVFNTYTDATHYERNCFGYDGSNARWQLWSDYGSAGGGTHPLEITFGQAIGSTTPWIFDNVSGFAIRPTTTNLYDIGTASYAVRNIYVGTGIYMAPGTADGCLNSVSRVITSTGTACGGGGGGMVYPGAGIGNSTGSAWGTSYTVSGTGTVLAAVASPTFTGTVNAAAASFTGNVTIGGTLSLSGGSGPNEVTVTLNSNACTTPAAGLSGYCFDTTANGGVLNIYENGAAGYGLTAAIAAKAPLASPTFTGTVTIPSGASIAGFAPLASPTFTGTPAAPTPGSNISTTQLPTTAWVNTYYAPLASPTFTGTVTIPTGASIAGFALLASPTFTGTPAAPTPGSNINTTQLPTTAWVNTYYAPLASPTFTGTVTIPTATAGTNSTAAASTAYVDAGGECEWLTNQAGSYSGTGNTLAASTTKATLWGVYLAKACTTSAVTYFPGTADNSANTYDLGLLNASGNIVVHTGTTAGTTFAPSTAAVISLNWTASNVLLTPGRYYIALTSNTSSAPATLKGTASNAFSFVSNVTETVTAGGLLNNGITIPADSYASGAQIPLLLIH